MQNYIHNFSYSEKWNKGLRVTIFHEFYHALQLSYISFYTNESFWFEASAAGFEEITTPDVDDYITHRAQGTDTTPSPLTASGTADNKAAGRLRCFGEAQEVTVALLLPTSHSTLLIALC